MNRDLIKEIRKKSDQIRDLSEAPFKSDQEIKELAQANREMDFLLSQIKDTKTLDQLNDVMDLAIQQPKDNVKNLEEVTDQLDLTQKEGGKLEKEDAEYKYKMLLLKEKHLKTLLKTQKKQDEIDELTKKLQEMEQESKYYTNKKNIDGTYSIREEKYSRRLKELKDNYKNAVGYADKFKAMQEILGFKMIKGQKLFNNGMIKTVKGVNTVTKSIGEISDSFGELGNYSGYETRTKPKTTKSKRKSKKKSKKSKKKTKETSTRSHNDFGFNKESFFNT